MRFGLAAVGVLSCGGRSQRCPAMSAVRVRWGSDLSCL